MAEDRGVLAANVAIDRVVLAQSTGVIIVADGALRTERQAPVVAGRDAVLRVWLDGSDAEARSVQVAATVVDVDDVTWETREEVLVEGPSAEVDLLLPASAMQPGAALAVAVLESDDVERDGDVTSSRMPQGEGVFVDLDARVVPPLRVVLVPLTLDGVGPTFSDDDVAYYQNALLGWFPTSEVHIELHSEPLSRDSALLSVDDVADEVFLLGQRRLQDEADDDVVYFGMYDAFVSLGLAGASDFSPELRAAVGPAGVNRSSAKVMAHEIGHLMGALHAPSCAAGFADPNFPDDDGTVGVETLDPLSGEWRPPDVADVMGYCSDGATSPYTAARMMRGLTWWGAP